MVYILNKSGEMVGPATPADVKKATYINGLVLTDGKDIKRTLTGYNGYLYEIEAVSVFGKEKPTITKETIYGFIDISEAKNEVLKEFNIKLKKYISKNDTEKARQLKDKYDNLIKRLEENQCVSYSLAVSYSKQRRIHKEENFNIINNEKVSMNKIYGETWKRLL